MVGGGRCVLYQMMGNLFPVQWIASTVENASPDEFFRNAWLCYNVRVFVCKHKGMCLPSPLGTRAAAGWFGISGQRSPHRPFVKCNICRTLQIPQSEGVWTERRRKGCRHWLGVAPAHGGRPLPTGDAHCPPSGSCVVRRKQAGVWGTPQKWAGVLPPSSQTGPSLAKSHKSRSFLTAIIETEKNLWFC